jgi:hypothetical protein
MLSTTKRMTVVMNNSKPPAKDVQTHLGRKLRAVYGEMVQEPVPDKFLSLLEQLAKTEGNQDQDELDIPGRTDGEHQGTGKEPRS